VSLPSELVFEAGHVRIKRDLVNVDFSREWEMNR